MRYVLGFVCVCALGLVSLVGCGSEAAMLCEGVVCEDDGNECTSDACDPATGNCDHPPVEDGTGCADGVCRDGVCGPLCVANVCHCSEAGIRAAIKAGGGNDPYRFNCDGPTTVMTNAEIEIDNDVTLDGEGNLTVDGNDAHRVFSVADNIAAELRGMTVTRGAAQDNGGGISNSGALRLTNTTVSSNSSVSDGGGIWNQGTLTLLDSAVTDNTAAGSGGGIENNSGFTELNRCTVSGNTAMAGGGGAIESTRPATLLLTNTTVSGNFPAPGRGAIENGGEARVASSTLQQRDGSLLWDGAGGWVMFRNTILDGECVGTWSEYGSNIESPGNTCGLWPGDNRVSVSAAELDLGPLQDNGGATLTHLPGPSSVAIDMTEPWDCVDANWWPLETDQRGVGRPQGPLCDVGSVEAPSLCGGVDCDDQNECTSDSCNPADASCGHDPVPDGRYCEFDGWPGLCIGGVCTENVCASYPYPCDDGNQCTSDDCDPFTEECTNDPVPDFEYCLLGGGGGSDGGVGGAGMPGVCFEGECIEDLCPPSYPDPCNDGNECTFDDCDPFTGDCTNDPVPDGRYCFLGGGGSGGAGGTGGGGGTGGTGGTGGMNGTGVCVAGTCEPAPVCGAGQTIPAGAHTAEGMLSCITQPPVPVPPTRVLVKMAATPFGETQPGENGFDLQVELGFDAESVDLALNLGVSEVVFRSAVATMNATMGDSNPAPVAVEQDPVPCILSFEPGMAATFVTPPVSGSWTLDQGSTLELTTEQVEEILVAMDMEFFLTTVGPGANCDWETPPPAVSFTAPL